MLRTNLPRAIRHLRRRYGWRQSDLGDRAGVSREIVSRIERGVVRGLTVQNIEKVSAALHASVDITVRWQGEQLDRLVDAAHAHLVQTVCRQLSESGWVVEVEVSFNHYGDRGRVDVLAFHAPSQTLLIVEVKSAVGDLQETLGRLDVKARLGRMLAAQSGWGVPHAVIPALVIGDLRRARRVVSDHESSFNRYSLRGRKALAWLRRPQSPAPTGLLWFANLPESNGVSVTRDQRGGQQRAVTHVECESDGSRTAHGHSASVV